MMKNFVIALALGLLQFHQSFAGQQRSLYGVNPIIFKDLVKICKVDDPEEIATGTYDGTWTLHFAKEVSKDVVQGGLMDAGQETTEKYLTLLKLKFPVGKIYHPKAPGFNLLSWDGLYGTVENSEIVAQGNKMVLAVKFATSRASVVQKNGISHLYDVYYISINEDSGRLVFDDETLRANFKIGDLVKYTSKAEPHGDPRNIDECPLRVITVLKQGTNEMMFAKPMVTIVCDEINKLDGRLFSTDLEQKKITVEVKCIENTNEIQELVKGYIVKDQAYTVNPNGIGLIAGAKYTVGDLEEFNGDNYTKKRSMMIHFVKSV